MKETNQYALAERIARVLPKFYQPKPNRFSVTQLIDAPRIRTLALQRWDDVTYDISSGMATVIGLGVHERAERLTPDDEDAERKLVDEVDGAEVVGKSDNCYGSTIIDTKTTAVRALGFESIIKKWIAQTNVYAWQRRKRGQEITKLIIDVIIRDFKLTDYLRSDKKLITVHYKIDETHKIIDGYPPIGYIELELPLWTFEEQENYVKSQLEYHRMMPYECTPDDRWEKPTCYAIKKKGQKKAVLASVNGEKVTSSARINAIAKEKGWLLGKEYFVEKRQGERTRCDNYCSFGCVCKFSKKCIDKYKEAD